MLLLDAAQALLLVRICDRYLERGRSEAGLLVALLRYQIRRARRIQG